MVRQTTPGGTSNVTKPRLKFKPAGKGTIKAVPDGKYTESIEKKYRGKKSYNKMRAMNPPIEDEQSSGPNPIGRPSSYDNDLHPSLAFKFCLLGCADTRLAENLEISLECLMIWKNKYPKFVQAIYEGRDLANANIVKSMYHRACGFEYEEKEYEAVLVKDPQNPKKYLFDEDGFVVKELALTKKKIKHVAADVSAAKFVLWNRTKSLPKDQQWNDKQEIDITSGGEKLASVVVLPPKVEVE